MTLNDRMHRWFLRDLLATPSGRAYMLTTLSARAEAGAVHRLDALLERELETDVAPVVRKHRDDALRHAGLYADCAMRQGGRVPEIPGSRSVQGAIDRHVGEAEAGDRHVDETGRDDRSVTEALLLLQVRAERAVRELPAVATALRPFDPRSAGIVVEIATDERRHLRDYDALAARHARTLATVEAALARSRRAEALAGKEHALRTIDFAVAQGLLGSRTKGLFWRGVGAAEALGELPWAGRGQNSKRTTHAVGPTTA